jgi:hypothetical protein
MTDDKQNKAARTSAQGSAAKAPRKAPPASTDLAKLQHQVGNQAVQRFLAQRSAAGPTPLDEETANSIDRARGGGYALDEELQSSLGATMGYDFSQVNIHTSPEANQLNRQLGAKAFTTGQDVFFQADAYQPHTTAGRELIAHELTHVVQQGTGQVGSASRMQVNAPDDSYEREANAVAKTATSQGAPPQVQRQEEEEEDLLQMQELDEDEELAA